MKTISNLSFVFAALLISIYGQAQNEKANQILQNAISTHGGEKYNLASYQFTFRGKVYTFTNSESGYSYSVKMNKGSKEVYDVLENGVFKRTINGKEVTLSTRESNGYGESLNSVIYFATLPHKLNDEAVFKSYQGEVMIKGQKYNALKITFSEQNGGKDYDDTYYYWINQKTNTMDYFAYNYKVNGGGVRFRSAYNARLVDGIRFQDYVNYKAPLHTPLADLPILFENGKLEKLSVIDTEDVVNLKR